MKLLLMVLFVVLAIGDVATTAKALKLPGAMEASPLPRALFRLAPPVMVMAVLKSFGLAFLFYALYSRGTEPWHEVFRWSVVGLLFAASIFVLASNLRFLRRA